MLSVWLIIVLCNHTNYCVSERHSGMNFNHRNLFAIFTKIPFLLKERKQHGLTKRGKNTEIGIIFTFFITPWSRLQIQMGVMPQLWVGASVSTERHIWKYWPHECKIHRKRKKRKSNYSPVNAVIFYLKADLVVTSGDGFMWSFKGLDWLTGSFPLLNY